jgi:hypothetical protein
MIGAILMSTFTLVVLIAATLLPRWPAVARNMAFPLSMRLGSYASFSVIERSRELFVLVAASLSHQQDLEVVSKALILKFRPAFPHRLSPGLVLVAVCVTTQLFNQSLDTLLCVHHGVLL